jgi:molecular chaperone GrpE
MAPPAEEKRIGHEERRMLEAGKAREKELGERLMRLQAEFENYKKRAVRESEVMREKAAADAMLKLLPIIDDFDMAIAHMDNSPHKEFKRGMELIYAKLLDTLNKEGVVEMKALGESFDPYKHDALRAAEGEEGKIVEVVQKGYVFRGNVLRHAKVAVGKGKGGQK